MNYQNVLCVGDSLTFGARTYGCYPLSLGRMLTDRTPYMWRVINEAHNGHTCRELWFAVNRILDRIADTYIACVLIGTNDVGNSSPPELFRDYYSQVLNAFLIKKFRQIFCGGIPPIYPDGHAFIDQSCVDRRDTLNRIIREVVDATPRARFVVTEGLGRDDYEDSVHFGESGNDKIARCFADAIVSV
jgi:hypothetical protein